jgi:hypothetical protein
VAGIFEGRLAPVSCCSEMSLAGRQGFELGARPVSKLVMARDFWFQALESQAVTSLRFVHCRPPESARFSARRGDILETASCIRDRSPWRNRDDHAAATYPRNVVPQRTMARQKPREFAPRVFGLLTRTSNPPVNRSDAEASPSERAHDEDGDNQ